MVVLQVPPKKSSKTFCALLSIFQVSIQLKKKRYNERKKEGRKEKKEGRKERRKEGKKERTKKRQIKRHKTASDRNGTHELYSTIF